MATVYKVEITSHWINYTKEDLEKLLSDAIKESEREKNNEITVEVKDRK